MSDIVNEPVPVEADLEPEIQDKSQEPEDSDVVTLTLNDVLELEDELIENTAAVLGAANDKVCSYNEVRHLNYKQWLSQRKFGGNTLFRAI